MHSKGSKSNKDRSGRIAAKNKSSTSNPDHNDIDKKETVKIYNFNQEHSIKDSFQTSGNPTERRDETPTVEAENNIISQDKGLEKETAKHENRKEDKDELQTINETKGDESIREPVQDNNRYSNVNLVTEDKEPENQNENIIKLEEIDEVPVREKKEEVPDDYVFKKPETTVIII